MISNIEQIKDRANIAEIIQQYVKLKKTGPNLIGLCPFHSEKTPSFTVSESRGIYKCFGCGKSGDVIQFLTDHNGLNYIQAIKFIAEKYNIPIEEDTKTYERPVERLENLHPDTIKYFETRGISNNTILRFKITECLEWMPKTNAETRAICFNYYKDETLVNIKFRAKDKDFKLAKND